MKVGNNPRGFLYLIIDDKTDLPVYVADTAAEAIEWLDCTRSTLYRMINTGSSFNGYRCEKIDNCN